ncbi:hypothetical protein SAMN05216198_0110 [Halopseudomonas litoralis]|uniref:Uncharacterized protein n=1 Tax=Halopseudomonas litoralis TaxID=797277 RepID=A0A1H1L6R2_9GAMM|nr:hypothetical protein [Halopseudomonas litoralis]SDR70097.1 hypothetical protein SAMN05216198_0110 [Halopseudomonas litoralis]
MNKQFALAQLKRQFSELHRFESNLDDQQAAILLYGGLTGFIAGLECGDVITFSEAGFLRVLASNAFLNSRRAA